MQSLKSRIATLAGVAAVTVFGMVTASAHHSTAAFDNTVVIKIEGTITQFRWINPHASIKIDGVAEGDAPDGVWTIEMTAPTILVNQGWTRNALKVGDKVTIYVNPLRSVAVLNDGSQGSLYVGAVLANGNKLGRTDGKGQGSAN